MDNTWEASYNCKELDDLYSLLKNMKKNKEKIHKKLYDTFVDNNFMGYVLNIENAHILKLLNDYKVKTVCKVTGNKLKKKIVEFINFYLTKEQKKRIKEQQKELLKEEKYYLMVFMYKRGERKNIEHLEDIEYFKTKKELQEMLNWCEKEYKKNDGWHNFYVSYGKNTPNGLREIEKRIYRHW